ncbi:hypothetical protein [Bacteroides heparinolyticus]
MPLFGLLLVVGLGMLIAKFY